MFAHIAVIGVLFRSWRVMVGRKVGSDDNHIRPSIVRGFVPVCTHKHPERIHHNGQPIETEPPEMKSVVESLDESELYKCLCA